MSNNKEKEIQKIVSMINDKSIKFKDEISLKMFVSHMEDLWERLKKTEVLESPETAYEAILIELDKNSLNIAKEVSEYTFNLFGLEPTDMEIVLIATHIQTQKT